MLITVLVEFVIFGLFAMLATVVGVTFYLAITLIHWFLER